MKGNALHNIERIESSLRETADQLCTNSNLTTSENAMPVSVVPESNANFGWLRHVFCHCAGSGASGARIIRRPGVA